MLPWAADGQLSSFHDLSAVHVWQAASRSVWYKTLARVANGPQDPRLTTSCSRVDATPSLRQLSLSS